MCVYVWSPLQSIALKSSSSEKAQLIMILLRYTIYALYIYIDEFESYQSQFDVCLICMCACIYLSICVYSLCVCSLCACVCVYLYPAAAAACHTLRNFCTTARTTSSHKLPGLVACLAWRVDAAFVAAACRHTLT